jgi:acyl-CoA thioester hydrolase
MTAPGRIKSSPYRVIYGDTDQMGVVYYANYLRWFEIGRTEWLRDIGSPYREIERRGLRFPVTQVSCQYRRPAHYDDELTIETGLATLGRVSLVFRYQIYRGNDRTLLAEGETKHACVNQKGEITRIPSSLSAALCTV